MTTDRPKRKRKVRHHHTFLLGVLKSKSGGKLKLVPGPRVPVVRPRRKVALELTLDDVRQAKKERGQGDTQHCALACLVRRQADRFPHPVTGQVELMDSRAFVAIAENEYEYPTRAARYEHDCGRLTKMFDRNGGIEELEAEIIKKGGKIDIMLRPYRLRNGEKTYASKSHGQDTGERRKIMRERRFTRLFGVGEAAGKVVDKETYEQIIALSD